jgi:hypothetical protein
MVYSRGKHVREFAWLTAGASAGALVRHSVDQIQSDAGVALLLTLLLTTTAAALIGFASTMPVRHRARTILLGAGGTAGSLSAAATRAAAATPVQAAIGSAGYIAGAVVGFAVGVLVALYASNYERQERY